MTETSLYVVREKNSSGNGAILAVFSNEGLAQTHHAKLRKIDTGGFGMRKYEVVPLGVNEVTQYEPRYYAIYSIEAAEPELIKEQIQCGCDTLALSLLPNEIDTDDPEFTAFTTYGWSEEETIREMVDLVQAHVDRWYIENDPDGELYG
jgi:hypothetical protein